MEYIKPKSGGDIVTLISNLLIMGWNTIEMLRGYGEDQDVKTIFKRAGIYVEDPDYEKPKKLYPKFVREEWDGKNRVLYYRLPKGLSYKKIRKNMDVIDYGLKAEVLPKYLENDTTADFSLKILSGKLLDYIKADLGKIAEEIKEQGSGLWVPLGYSRRGLECINLADDNSSHIMIGGSIGGGKTTLLRLIMVMLHMVYTREEVVLWLADFKHGNEIQILGKNPELVDMKCSDPGESQSYFMELYAETQRRYDAFHRIGVTNITEFNQKSKEKIPHIILIIDELGKLEGKKYEHSRLALKHIAGDGRAAGVHVIMSMHRPTANIVDGTMKNNMPVTVAFRSNPVSARVLLGEDLWEASLMIDAEIAGRALVDWMHQILIQVPYITTDKTKRVMSAYQRQSAPQGHHENRMENEDRNGGIRKQIRT